MPGMTSGAPGGPAGQSLRLLFILLTGLLVTSVTFVLSTSLKTVSPKLALSALGLLGLLTVAVAARRLKEFGIFGLVASVSLPLNYHFSYRDGHVGAADGLTVEVVDVWMLLLAPLLLARLIVSPAFRLSPSAAYLWPLSALLVAGALSTYNSVDIELSAWGLIATGRAIMFFLILSNSVRSKADIGAALMGIAAAGLLASLVCMAEAVTQSNFASSSVLEDEDWERVFRSAGFLTPTLTGGYLASVAAVLAGVTFFEDRLWVRLGAGAAMAMVLTGLALTLTRAAWVSLSVGLLALGAAAFFKGRIRPAHVAGVALMGVAIAALASMATSRRVDEGLDNIVARLELLNTTANMVQEAPVVGVGLNTYVARMDEFAARSALHDFEYLVHNKYALVWAETGTLGLLAFLWLAAMPLIHARRLFLAPAGLLLAAGSGAIAAFVTLLVHMLFESYESGPPLFQFLTMVALVAALRRYQSQFASATGYGGTFSPSGQRVEQSTKDSSTLPKQAGSIP